MSSDTALAGSRVVISSRGRIFYATFVRREPGRVVVKMPDGRETSFAESSVLLPIVNAYGLVERLEGRAS